MAFAFLPHTVEKAVLRLFEDLATPASLATSLLYKHGEWDQLATRQVNPSNYLDSLSYWKDSTAVNLLRKLEELPTTFDRKAVAEETFQKCERECFRTNRRLAPYLAVNPGSFPEVDGRLVLFFKRARKNAERILGRFPDTDVESVNGRFGPGATFGDRGRLTTLPDKMSSIPTLTPAAWPYHFPWLGTLWSKAVMSAGNRPSYVQGNRFTTVPKDCTKDRGIAVEPSINLFYQLGYGRVLRGRLRRVGLDLTNGQDVHRRVACKASQDGSFSTIDLSNASDTVCTNLVKLVLPPLWFDALNELRSQKTLFKGRWHTLDKFSSMGNGFTFELETLVFLCLILAIRPDSSLEPGKDVYVYGDDIIVPSERSKEVVSALRFCGLTPNMKKTFVSGPFRESCGGDYFLGEDVRPHFLKESPNAPEQLYSLANGLSRLHANDSRRTRFVLPAWFRVLDALPGQLRRLRGPKDLGDIVLHDREEAWVVRWRGGIRYIKVYRPARYRKVPWSVWRSDVVLAAATYGIRNDRRDSGVIPRDAVAGYKVGWVPRS